MTDERVRREIRSVREERADPAFRERLKREFVSGTFSGPATTAVAPARRLPRWAWLLAPATVVVLIVVLVPERTSPRWSVHDVRGEGNVVIDGNSVPGADHDRLARSIGAGTRARIDDGLVLDLLLEERLLLELDEGADVSIPVLPENGTGTPLVADVHAGELRVKTGPAFAGLELRILTTEGRTEIVGTSVSVYKGGDFTCVCVLEGTARIGADDSGLEDVPSGMRKVMFADGRPSLITEIEPHHAAGLEEFVTRQREVFARGR